jgi:hypothetical protein
LENFADKRGPSGQRFGEKRIDTLQRRHILAILEGMTRDMKRNWIKALRGLMAFAVAEQIRSDDATQGIKLERATKSVGHMTWLEPQVEQYRQRHPLGTAAPSGSGSDATSVSLHALTMLLAMSAIGP